MKRSLQCFVVLTCVLVTLSLTSHKVQGQDHAGGGSPHQTAKGTPEGPAIQMLLGRQVSRRDLRKLVTTKRIADEQPDLAEYYRVATMRLLSEAREYESFARSAGDPTPLSEPNHYGVSRSARFDYLVAKDKLKKAQDDNLLAAINTQATQKEGCFSCHSFHGRGGRAGPDLAVEGTRRRSRAWLISHFKDPQALSTGSAMPAFTGFTDRQLEVLSTFLEYQK